MMYNTSPFSQFFFYMSITEFFNLVAKKDYLVQSPHFSLKKTKDNFTII